MRDFLELQSRYKDKESGKFTEAGFTRLSVRGTTPDLMAQILVSHMETIRDSNSEQFTVGLYHVNPSVKTTVIGVITFEVENAKNETENKCGNSISIARRSRYASFRAKTFTR